MVEEEIMLFFPFFFESPVRRKVPVSVKMQDHTEPVRNCIYKRKKHAFKLKKTKQNTTT